MRINNSQVMAIAAMVLSITTNLHAGERAWNAADAAKAMDARAAWWLEWPNSARGEKTACISCHTTLGYGLARPALGKILGEKEPGAVEKQFFDTVKKRVANWDKIVGDSPFRPFYGGDRKPTALGTEAVLNALVLANYDASRGNGVLSDATKQALKHLWSTQQPDGTWQWLEFGLRPWETDAKFFGASLAALAIGAAGNEYYDSADVQPKLTLLKKYLSSQAAKQRLHDRTILLWASTKLPGVLTGAERSITVKAILETQDSDGGFRSARLGVAPLKKAAWTSFGVTQKGAVADGYATGLAVLALRSAGAAREDGGLKKAIAWLNANQSKGVWAGTYLNKNRDPESDVGQFMQDGATAFAVLALTDN